MTFSKEEQFKRKTYAAGKIVEYALQVARLRSFGSHINEDGIIERLSASDIKTHITGYEILVRGQARTLLELMSRDGVPEVDAPEKDS